jgi:hypothetical protein
MRFNSFEEIENHIVEYLKSEEEKIKKQKEEIDFVLEEIKKWKREVD